MKITQLPHKVLHQEAEKIKFPLDEKTIRQIEQMIKYVDDSQKEGFEDRAGVGIAAPQMGINSKMFYVNIPLQGKENYREFLINPILVGESNAEAAIAEGEGCLSVPENTPHSQGYVIRKFKVVMKGYSYFAKKEIKVSKVAYEAIVLQHEYDHLCGKLFIDRIDRKNPWKKTQELILI